MTKVFIAARVGAKSKRKVEKNLKRYRAFARMAILQGFDAEATGVYYCMLLDELSPKERELGMKLGQARALVCQEAWFLKNEDGSLSSGMQSDLEAIQMHNLALQSRGEQQKFKTIRVKYFTPEEVEHFFIRNDCGGMHDPYGYKLWQKGK